MDKVPGKRSEKPYTRRALAAGLAAATQAFPVVLVTGARQVGKTTLLRRSAAATRSYVTLDDPLVLQLAREDPALFMQRFKPPITIDEIQYAPQLLPYIKMAVDRESKAGAFWLSGSQQFHLMQGISESLAGRVAILRLLGLTQAELRGGPTVPFVPGIGVEARRLHPPLELAALYRAIWRGAYPHLALHPERSPGTFYASYLQTYLQRDLRDMTQVADLTCFTRFLRATAARTGQLLNLTALAGDAGISLNTAKKWLAVLEASDIVYLLPAWQSNLNKRLVRTPKLYFLDSGLCAYLTLWTSPETLAVGAMSGAILETWLVAEILKSFVHAGREAPIYFYRDKEQNEVDMLIHESGVLHPVEFKRTASPSRHDVENFSVLKRLGQPIGNGALLCLVGDELPLSSQVNALPMRYI